MFVVCVFVESLVYVHFADTNRRRWNSTDNREHSINSLVAMIFIKINEQLLVNFNPLQDKKNNLVGMFPR